MNASHVVSQGLAVELKEAGWPCDSEFCWVRDTAYVDDNSVYREASEPYLMSRSLRGIRAGYEVIAPAPLASELMESIPGSVLIWVASVGTTCETYWFCQGQDQPCFHRETLPDALAKLALHLMKENKLNLE